MWQEWMWCGVAVEVYNCEAIGMNGREGCVAFAGAKEWLVLICSVSFLQ